MSAAQSGVQTPLTEVRGKVAFITGGSSGIGLGLARVLSDAGMKVVFTYMREDHRDHALSMFAPGNAGVHAIKLDTADRDGMVRAADEAESVFGSVHLLCNNAGVGVTAQVSTASWDDWSWAMDVNVGGVFNGIRTFVPRMLKHGEGGHIVATSSSGGLVAGTLGVYVTTKFAVMGLMESLRTEMAGKNVGVSLFCPGLVKSAIASTDRNRPATHARVAPKGPPPGMPDLMSVAMDPMEAAVKVLAGIRRNDLYILTHPEFRAAVTERFELMMQSFSTDPVPEGRRAVTATFTPDIYAVDLAKKKSSV
jgi:NAD(P)-dependent dehydrogenase (short-subunit alcohol dehydrogenase family)